MLIRCRCPLWKQIITPWKNNSSRLLTVILEGQEVNPSHSQFYSTDVCVLFCTRANILFSFNKLYTGRVYHKSIDSEKLVRWQIASLETLIWKTRENGKVGKTVCWRKSRLLVFILGAMNKIAYWTKKKNPRPGL